MPFGPLRRAARSSRLSIWTAATPLLRHLTMMRSLRFGSIAGWRNARLVAACDPAGPSPKIISTQVASAAPLLTNQLLKANSGIRPQGRPEFARAGRRPWRREGRGGEGIVATLDGANDLLGAGGMGATGAGLGR